MQRSILLKDSRTGNELFYEKQLGLWISLLEKTGAAYLPGTWRVNAEGSSPWDKGSSPSVLSAKSVVPQLSDIGL